MVHVSSVTIFEKRSAFQTEKILKYIFKLEILS